MLATQVYTSPQARNEVCTSAAVAMFMAAVLAVLLLVYLKSFGERERTLAQVFIPLSDISSAAYERVLEPTDEGGEGFVRFLIDSALLGVGTVIVTLVASILGA